MNDNITYVLIRVDGDIGHQAMNAAVQAMEEHTSVEEASLYQFKTVTAQDDYDIGGPVIYFP